MPAGIAEGPVVLVVIEFDLVVRMLLLSPSLPLRGSGLGGLVLRWDATPRDATARRGPWPSRKTDRAARAGGGFPSLGRPCDIAVGTSDSGHGSRAARPLAVGLLASIDCRLAGRSSRPPFRHFPISRATVDQREAWRRSWPAALHRRNPMDRHRQQGPRPISVARSGRSPVPPASIAGESVPPPMPPLAPGPLPFHRQARIRNRYPRRPQASIAAILPGPPAAARTRTASRPERQSRRAAGHQFLVHTPDHFQLHRGPCSVNRALQASREARRKDCWRRTRHRRWGQLPWPS